MPTARHRRLESQGGIVGFGAPRQLGAMMGQKRLVGGDHGAMGVEGGLHRRLGRTVGAADQFHHRVGVGGARHFHRIVVPGDAVQRHPPILAAIAR
jgi:hypothetical protein